MERLCERIEHDCPNVRLVLHQRLVSLAAGKHPGELELAVKDSLEGRSYKLQTEHVIDFWRPFVPGTEQFSALIYPKYNAERPERPIEDLGLKRALVRQLLVEANPNIAAKIDIERRRVEHALRDELKDLGVYLVDQARRSGTALSAVIRSHLQDCPDIHRYMIDAVFRDLFGEDESWVEALLRTETELASKDALVDEYLPSVLAYGIQDWSKLPFGGAAHAWRPGVDPVQARTRLLAFGLEDQEEVTNVHVCGEAYSDFQGFIGRCSSLSGVGCARECPAKGVGLRQD